VPHPVIARASRAASFLGGVATLLAAALITLDVCLRYFFNRPLLGVDEIAGFLQTLVVFWALAYTFRQGGHIRVDLVTSRLAGPVRGWLRVLTLLIGIALLTVVSWVTLQTALSAFRLQRVSAVMLYPLWLPMMLIPTGLALMVAAMLADLARQVRSFGGPGADEVPPAERPE
jgi:TRAP-type C4-dicarboxylate transport system permease small subunit